MEILAPANGILRILKAVDEPVSPGVEIARIE